MGNYLQTAGVAIEAIRINRISWQILDGREFCVKQRRSWSGPVIRCANLFFRAVRQPVSVPTCVGDWQRRETESFNLLNGEEFHSFAKKPCAVCTEKIPGKSIASHFDEGTFSIEMLDAAAAELRRGHALYSEDADGPWSHGDANLANFLYDETGHRARMIDFELIHHQALPRVERQADDLLVFLQDLCGCISPDRWLSSGMRFLDGYGNAEVIDRLKNRLDVPHGLPLVWWIIRANYVRPVELRRRFDALREALEN